MEYRDEMHERAGGELDQQHLAKEEMMPAVSELVKRGWACIQQTVAVALLLWAVPGSSAGETCAPPAALVRALASAEVGDVVELGGLGAKQCPAVPMMQTWTGGKLILSDAPESPATPGKLYEDATLGATTTDVPNRILVYHANGRKAGPLRFAALLRNNGVAPGSLTVKKNGSAGPTRAYAHAGKRAFESWLTSSPAPSVNVPSGAWVRVDAGFDERQAQPKELLHAIIDYSFNQAHTIIICAAPPGVDVLRTCPIAESLVRDNHMRGTYPFTDVEYYSAVGAAVDPSAGVQQFTIGGRTDADPNALGVDPADGAWIANRGNYGVLYRIRVAHRAGGANRLALVLLPTLASWGGVLVADAGLTPSGAHELPPGPAVLTGNSRGVVGGFVASAGTMQFRFMPTGGASLPTRVLLVPVGARPVTNGSE